MSDEKEYEQSTESPTCSTPAVPGKPAMQAMLEQHVCTTCGDLVLFLILEDEEGNRLVHTFNVEVAMQWAHVFRDSAMDMIRYREALGPPMSMN